MSATPTITEEYQKIRVILSGLKTDSEHLRKISLSFPLAEPDVLTIEDKKALENKQKEIRLYSAKFGAVGLSSERLFLEFQKKFPSLKNNKNHPANMLLDINRCCLNIASLSKTGEIYRTSGEIINILNRLIKIINSILKKHFRKMRKL